jgi:hypothetical protein
VHAWVVYRREVMRTPVRTLAGEIGISKSSLDKFHKERCRPGKLWPRLRDWYMRTRGTKTDEYQTPPDLMVASALQLLSTLPNERRAVAMRALAEQMKGLHAGLPTPEWIGMFADLAERERGD